MTEKEEREQHLGDALFRCGTCRTKVRSWGENYCCPNGCLTRNRDLVDAFVTVVIGGRLERPDALGPGGAAAFADGPLAAQRETLTLLCTVLLLPASRESFDSFNPDSVKFEIKVEATDA